MLLSAKVPRGRNAPTPGLARHLRCLSESGEHVSDRQNRPHPCRRPYTRWYCRISQQSGWRIWSNDNFDVGIFPHSLGLSPVSPSSPLCLSLRICLLSLSLSLFCSSFPKTELDFFPTMLGKCFELNERRRYYQSMALPWIFPCRASQGSSTSSWSLLRRRGRRRHRGGPQWSQVRKGDVPAGPLELSSISLFRMG